MKLETAAMDRIRTEILSDDRERCGDHRRVGVLHEKRGGDDEGNEAAGAHNPAV
jgi:hypothetical protein